MEPLRLDLDFSLWRCGFRESAHPEWALGDQPTRLMRSVPPAPHSCCCVGLMLLEAGCPAEKLAGRDAANQVDAAGLPAQVKELLRNFAQVENTVSHLSWVAFAYALNDKERLTHPERMARITKLCAPHGITLTWRNVPAEIQQQFEQEMKLEHDAAAL